MGKNIEFSGVQIGDLRFPEHADSREARVDAKLSNKNQPHPFYAYYGCGLNGKLDTVTKTMAELQKLHSGSVIRINMFI